ncbi:diacylglycerol kinase family protein [Patescibacteria group bacterium]|nr:diacylglycerol kinase family protein [Patescibacteria group bacterium]
MLRFGRLLKSFKYAGKGIFYAFREEQNIKIHFLLAIVAILLAIYFQISIGEIIALVVVISLVLVAELINTVLERIVDIIKPRMHPYAKSIKDMQAGTVLVAAAAALVVGLLIFAPRVWQIFF